MKEILLFASKNSKNEFYIDSVVNDLDSFYYSLEYGDVAEGEFQIWKYPSGKMFDITPDRKVSESQYYSTPSKSIWLPQLKYRATDKGIVAAKYKQFSEMPKRLNIRRKLINYLKSSSTSRKKGK